MSEGHTVVVGAGVIGVSTAYYLARRGARVTALDDGDLTTSASTGNAGIVALGHPPLPRPGLIRQTMKWMLDPGSPLYVPLRFDPGLWWWMVDFARACRPAVFERSLRILGELGRAGGACWAALLDQEPFDCHQSREGWMDVYRSATAMAHGREDAGLLESLGYTIGHLSRAEVLEREPAFDASIIGATRFVEGVTLDPGRFLGQLAARAEHHGAAILRHKKVSRLRTDGRRPVAAEIEGGGVIEGDTFVLAAGMWTSGLARALGVRVPMQAGKGYHVHIPQIDPPLTMACVLADRHIAATPMGERIRLAGTVELSGLNLRLHPRRVEMLTEGAVDYLPAVAGVEASPGWCGLRPCTADGLPVIGPARECENLLIATGHAKYGLTLGPLTGKLIAESILDGRPSIDIGELGPARFGSH